MTKNKKKNEIRNALNRELDSVRLSDQMKRDILYNAQYGKKSAPGKQTYTYLWAAAAVVILLCASLLVTGTRVRPDTMGKPVKGGPVSAPVAAEGENGGNNAPMATPEVHPEYTDGYIDAEPTPEPTYGYIEAKPTPVYGTDLFMQFDSYDEVVPAAIGEIVWATENGRYYHLDSDCSGMQNASETTRNEASLAGKQPCPVCIAFVMPEVIEVTPEPTAMPVPSYLGTEHGKYYHLNEHCSGMQDAVWLSDLSGKQPCPVCIPYVTSTPMPMDAPSTPEPTETPVYRFYGTEHGTYFHADETCSGMQNAEWLSDLSGKQPCPVCIPYVTPTPMPMDAPSTPEPTEVPESAADDLSAVAQQVWYGAEDDYLFHRSPDCSALADAQQLDDLTGKLPCPYCVTYLSYADGDVHGTFHHSEYYGTEHGIFYHLEKRCSGMKNAVTLSDLTHKQPCPACILNAVFYPMAASTPEPIRAPGAEDIAIFWGTPQGNYYHLAEDCSGMKNSAWISRLDDRQPCPVCIGDSFWITSDGRYFHLDEHCSGMENAVPADSVEASNSAKIPCPVCIGSVLETGDPAGVNSIIGVNRYVTDDGCIMELEYVADAEFRLIAEPDTTNWYVDEVESEAYFFGEYLDHRLSDENIYLMEKAYKTDGKAGYEVRDTLVMLNGVNTEFSADSGDVPSGKEYRFDDVKNPFHECVLYVLDKPYEGNTAELTVVERTMQWWFDGEKVYRLTRDHNIVDEALNVIIGDGGKVFPVHEKVGFFGLEADAAGYPLGSNHYAIMEYDESLALSESELISVSGEVFKAEMTTDPTFHVNKVLGWRYPAETADYIDVLRVSDGESSVDIPMNPEGSLSLTVAKLTGLLNKCGVTDTETVNSTVASLILIGENGDILAMASQPVREVLNSAGVDDTDIELGNIIEEIIGIISLQEE